MCSGGGSPYKLVGQKKVKNTPWILLDRCFQKLSIFLEGPVVCFLLNFRQKRSKPPLSPHLFRRPFCEKPNQITSVYGIFPL